MKRNAPLRFCRVPQIHYPVLPAKILALIQMMFGDKSHSISTLSRLLQTPYISWLYGPMPATPAVLDLIRSGILCEPSRFSRTL